MHYSWWFNQMRPSDKAREPIIGEFFATEATSRPGEALIREGIQNSLDARLGDGKVRVRVYLSGRAGAASGNRLTKFLEGLGQHLNARDNGLRNPPSLDEDCPFLVFEDFGTTGLTGDPVALWPEEGQPNRFYHFFRAEGRTDKGEGDIGRWGVGKQALLRASRINTIFGYTRRHDDNRSVMMGISVLRSHSVNGIRYMPDGWFGRPPADPSRESVRPIEDEDFIDELRNIFNVSRAEEAGLTVVIPWYDPDITEHDLIRAVFRGYFWPILRDRLEVKLTWPGGELTLDRGALEREVPDDMNEELLPLIRLADWATGQSEDKRVKADGVRGHSWTQEPFSQSALSNLRDQYRQRRMIAVRVPLQIREKRGNVRESFFDVFLHNDGSEERRVPTYIRQGIIIPAVRQRARGVPRGLWSLVVVEDMPAASFVGDAENPAHTQWEKDSSNFKGKYAHGDKILDFIIRSPMEIARRLEEQEAREDKMILLDFFHLPPSVTGTPTIQPMPEKKTGRGPDQKGPPEKGPPKPYLIESANTGFAVAANPKARLEVPVCVVVRAAYHVRSGNPFKRYDPADFDFAHHIKAEVKGATILKKSRNTLVARITSPDFRIKLMGFDPRRDLRVDVREAEDTNAGSHA